MNKQLTQYSPVTVIGAGVIGISWTALFLANGMEVRVNDISDTLEEDIHHGLNTIKPALQALGYNVDNLTANLIIEKDLEKALKGVKVVQENGPENPAFKQDLYQKLEQLVDKDTLLFSSSSGIPATVIAERMVTPERVCIGHPFNPPHLIPLVEISAGEKTSQVTIDKAFEFYNILGKTPVEIKKEVPGFVANRLQSALFKECIHLVLEGVVDAKELDTIVQQSIGIRWAIGGPFLSFHLGGGQGGFEHFMAHLGRNMQQSWANLGQPELNDANVAKLIANVQTSYGEQTIDQLAEARDRSQITLLTALREK
ncbi:3-hydroxyacyl-CoA dehydrogenase NAD-binding domain-containing protein [Lysinibacillus sp. OL1_EC]|uniref:3-hydroxyacyl-CoA dehydrogenase NAD-binding domain-containing protein n=1 Tax=unclassified Lysinibacillus TaxID=2636778 RepID=UPI00103B3A93|nr:MULTISPECIES: 3-hydroxyacyl-CoA dehydrogenase NAD-binding domain-containing protein [unclassified Lysinibacillus]MCM0626954.1 3-hydroxyacyl-CoA dehydrogenase NAD-binding domain-containing protein [Lysinibacillus sp. OL1_EC]TBV85195.1 hydroxylacyl-CoA dehydrogenase [Lysinibacillus sp. OL1]UKJ43873.1 3-hydroxyacyl-CoA dehydrogenase NAD-binding domain-containing protein [Lysinibacillus sp. ACHW1.5]